MCSDIECLGISLNCSDTSDLQLFQFLSAILRKKRMLHTTFKLYMVSLFFEFFHLLVMCISYGKYANDGEDNYGSKTFGKTEKQQTVD